MTAEVSVMSGTLGDIFWDLPPWLTYAAGLDLGCNIYVANSTASEKEYALMARLSRDATVITEESLPVFGYAWFKVDPGDFVTLKGALRFGETNADLVVTLMERESGEATDSVATRLVAPATNTLPPTWPGAPGGTGASTNWSSVMGTMAPMLGMFMVGMVMASAFKPKEEQKVLLPGEKRIMPGGFYIEDKKQKTDLTQVLGGIAQLQTTEDAVRTQTTKLAGEAPGTGSATADWQVGEADVASIGASGISNKLHSLLLSLSNLVGTAVTVRLYMKVNGVERKVYEQGFNATTDPPGLWIVNGTVAIHELLRVTLQSNDAADNGQAVDYDYLLEGM